MSIKEIEIQNDAERYFWVSYHLIVLLSSFFGDTFILYASFQRDTFKINRFIVLIMQHIAVCDLLYATTIVLPGTITLTANFWILGITVCYIPAYAQYIFYSANNVLTATLAASKYLLLKFPHHKAWSTKNAHIACGVIWVSALITPGLMLDIAPDDIYFNYRVHNCKYSSKNEVWNYLQPILGFIFIIAPIFVIICTTVPTLKYLATAVRSARRAGGNVPRQGTWAVALTAVVFCISNIPLVVAEAVNNFVANDFILFHAHVQRIITFMTMINIMSNFYIYALTIKHFRRFLLSKAKSIVPSFKGPSKRLQQVYTSKMLATNTEVTTDHDINVKK